MASVIAVEPAVCNAGAGAGPMVLRLRIRELAHTQPRFGYLRIRVRRRNTEQWSMGFMYPGLADSDRLGC